jgi:predicted O-methyltransferase YrrM
VSFDQSFVEGAAQRYLTGLVPLPYRNMELMEREIADEGRPAIGRGTGSILRALVAATGGVRVLEVGTNVGYSALWMASGLARGGRIDTIEIDEPIAARAKRNFANAGQAASIAVHVGPALEVLPRLRGPYDLVFLDAVKAEYPRYLDEALRLTRVGGIVAADNVLWGGRAWDEKAQDDDTRGIREYTRRVMADARLASTLVPSEDGLMVSAVRAPGA